MAIYSLIIFFVFFLIILIFRRFILENLIPRIFSLSFLLIAFVLSGVLFFLIYLGMDVLLEDNIFESKFYISDHYHQYLNYLYFSFISQLTIGYGDIYPVHPIGKSLSMIQGMIGAVFMGGLIASLLEFSKSALNYLYISEVRFLHCDAASNHNSEIFNMDLKLTKTKGSLFNDFRVFILAEHADGERFQVLSKEYKEINVKNEITIDISQKNVVPRFVDYKGELAYETFNPTPQSMTARGMVGGNTVFKFVDLYVRYQYSFESKLYEKEIKIQDKNQLALLLSHLGQRETDWELNARH